MTTIAATSAPKSIEQRVIIGSFDLVRNAHTTAGTQVWSNKQAGEECERLGQKR
jgi:hypothetical protein